MFSRVIASLLALVLFWSDLSAQEQAFSLASPDVAQAHTLQASISPYAGTDGSVDDHHLDDLPAQAHAEAGADLPGLIHGSPDVQMPVLAMARPTPLRTAALRPLYLDVPQRPPCVIDRAA